MNYREATTTKRPVEVVDYRPISFGAAIALVCLTIAMSAFMVFNATTARSTIGGGAMAVVAVTIGLFSLMILGWARLAFDLDQDRVVYTRHRFPLRPITRTLRGEDVQCARVTSRTGNRGRTLYSVSLDLVGGEELALLPGASTDKTRHYDAANKINTLLAQLRQQRNA